MGDEAIVMTSSAQLGMLVNLLDTGCSRVPDINNDEQGKTSAHMRVRETEI